MVHASAFQVNSVSAVAFSPDTTAFEPATVLTRILGRHLDVFNGQVQSLPLPPLAPPELPRSSLVARTRCGR